MMTTRITRTRRRSRRFSPIFPVSILLLSSLLFVLVFPLLDVTVASEEDTVTADAAATAVESCSILSLIPFPTATTNAYDDGNSYYYYYDYIAAAQLAIDHFNTRNDIIVKEIGQLPTICDGFHFTSHFVSDTHNDNPDTTVKATINHITASAATNNRLCGIIGPSTNTQNAITAVSTISSSYNIPQLLYTTVSNEMLIPSTSHLYKTTIGINWTYETRAKMMLDFLAMPGYYREYLIIISSSENDPYYMNSPKFKETLIEVGLSYNVEIFLFTIPTSGGESVEQQQQLQQELQEILQRVKSTGVQTLYLNLLSVEEMIDIAPILDTVGLLVDNYMYVLNPDTIPADRITETLGNIQVDSSADRLFTGALLFHPLDQFLLSSTNDGGTTEGGGGGAATTAGKDPFLYAWHNELNETFVERINELILPKGGKGEVIGGGVDGSDGGTSSSLQQQAPSLQQLLPGDYFQGHGPSPHVAFIYDSIMTLGIGKCNVIASEGEATAVLELEVEPINDVETIGGDETADNDDGNTTTTTAIEDAADLADGDDNVRKRQRRTLAGSYASGAVVLEGQKDSGQQLDPYIESLIKDVNFVGATGRVNFLKHTKIRNPSSITVGVYNIRPKAVDDVHDEASSSSTSSSSSYNHTYEAILTFIWKELSGWEHYQNETNIWRNGQTDVVEEYRDIVMKNYLEGYVRGIGLTLLSIAIIINIGCIIMLKYMYNDSIIQRSQPFFLILICVGSVLTSVSIFTLSFDEGSVVTWISVNESTPEILSAFCTITPWFFFVGHITSFATLATKLYRVDKVLQFRRGNKVTITQVIGPLVIILFITLIILTIWTILDPWIWYRELINDIPSETYGECTCVNNNFWYYFGSLSILLVGSEIITIFFAWKTSDVPEDFNDTTAVNYAIVTQLQAWFIGIPILAVLGNTNVNATYLGRVLLIFIMAISSVVIVVCPKILQALYLRRHPEIVDEVRRSRVSVTGLSTVAGVGGSARHSMRASSSKHLLNKRQSNAAMMIASTSTSRPSNAARVSNVSSARFSTNSDDIGNMSFGDGAMSLNISNHSATNNRHHHHRHGGSRDSSIKDNGRSSFEIDLNISGHSSKDGGGLLSLDDLSKDDDGSRSKATNNSKDMNSSCGSFDLMETLPEASETNDEHERDPSSHPPSPSPAVKQNVVVVVSATPSGSEAATISPPTSVDDD